MSVRTTLIAATISATLALNGCATMSSSSSDSSQPNQTKSVAKGAGIGAGVGCAAGALLGALMHRNALGGCAVGAVAGGVSGAVIGEESYKKQLAQYQAAQAQAQAAGLRAKLETQQVTPSDSKQATAAVSRLVISYDPADMQRLGPKTRATFDKLGEILVQAKEKQTIEFTGANLHTSEIPMDQLAQRKALDNANVLDHCGSDAHPDYTIVISPNPIH
jgi:outer membrane lipoprotein SlyB